MSHTLKAAETAYVPSKILIISLIILLTIFSGHASANGISTIEELDASYSSRSCKECHEETHKGWKRSWHGRSITDSRVLRTWRTFILNGLDHSEGSRRDLKDICLPCHAPQTKDASDDLVREIAAMIITAVEEIDSYDTEFETPEPETLTITGPEDMVEVVIETKPDHELPETKDIELPSPWIRNKLDGIGAIIFSLFKEPAPIPIEDNRSDKAEDHSAEAGNDKAREKVKAEAIIEEDDTPPDPPEDLTVSFVEDGEMPLEPTEDLAKDLTAKLIIDDGKVKIEYMPYDPADDLKDPVFLDKGETMGETALRKLSKLNINCVICHSMKALPGGNPRPNTIYGTGRTGSAAHKEALGAETAISGFMKTSEFCAQCHHGCPPGMPSSICPTLWTSYKEDYVARGGDKTCQDCHMNGPDKKSHRFPGIYETDQVKRGIAFTLNAEPTRYVHHLENRIVPAIVINVKVKNTAGHGIPNGCTYIPKTAMEVSVRDQNGNELFFKDKIYGVYNLHLPHNTDGYLGLNEWDITAMNRLNLGIDPGDTDSNTYVVPLNEETTSVVIEAVFKYIYEEGISTVIHKEIKEIEFEIDKNP